MHLSFSDRWAASKNVLNFAYIHRFLQQRELVRRIRVGHVGDGQLLCPDTETSFRKCMLVMWQLGLYKCISFEIIANIVYVMDFNH